MSLRLNGPKMETTPADWHLKKYIVARMLSPTKKTSSVVTFRDFRSVHEKYVTLMSECRDGELRGGPINEMLAPEFPGDSPMAWIDIDSRDWKAFREWETSAIFPLVPDSYRAIPSSTGRIHIYVKTDRVLFEMQAWRWRDVMSREAPTNIGAHLDRIYGPTLPLPVLLPHAQTGSPMMPRDLVRKCKAVTKLPKSVGMTMFERWCQMQGDER